MGNLIVSIILIIATILFVLGLYSLTQQTPEARARREEKEFRKKQEERFKKVTELWGDISSYECYLNIKEKLRDDRKRTSNKIKT